MRISDWSSDVCSSDLGEGLLDAEGQDGLLDLALDGDLVGQQEVLGYPLGDGGGTDRPAVGAEVGDVGDHGAQHRNGVDARVVVEVLVRSEEHTAENQSLMRSSEAVCCLQNQMRVIRQLVTD